MESFFVIFINVTIDQESWTFNWLFFFKHQHNSKILMYYEFTIGGGAVVLDAQLKLIKGLKVITP